MTETPELPMTTHCPVCDRYIFLLGENDFQCECGTVFDMVWEDEQWKIDLKTIGSDQ